MKEVKEEIKALAEEYKSAKGIKGALAFKHNDQVVFPVEFLEWVTAKYLLKLNKVFDEARYELDKYKDLSK